MGIGTLRRYHKPLDAEGAANAAPEVAPGTIESEAEAKAAAEANAAKLAEEQAAQAEAANSHPDTIAANDEPEAAAASSVHPIIQEAGGVEENPQEPVPPTIPTLPEGVESEAGAEFNEVTEGIAIVAGTEEGKQAQAEAVAAETPTNHGELARPNRGSSRADWEAYALADPNGAPDVSSLNRDSIAELYLGPKA